MEVSRPPRFTAVAVSLCLLVAASSLHRRWRRTRAAQLWSLADLDHGVTHLAVVMDGNRRYGRQHAGTDVPPVVADQIASCCHDVIDCTEPTGNTSSGEATRHLQFFKSLIKNTVLDGHRSGGEKLVEFIGYCVEAHISMLTVYAFSSENWGRPPLEVNVLITLFIYFFERIRGVAQEMGLFIRFISTDLRPFPATVKKLMEAIEEETRRHTPRILTVNVCVGYGGQSEVAGACNRIIRRHPHNHVEVTTSDLRQEMLRSITQERHEEEDVCVFGSGQTQEPQLIIRTSGEMRLSNFLLYECAYSELTFLPKTWPEMSKEDLYGALRDYSHRLRRTGK